MSLEGSHPANQLYKRLFSLPEDDVAGKSWWSGFDGIVGDIKNLTDSRSVAGACFSVAEVLLARGESNPMEKSMVNHALHKQLVPLWEREVEKENWVQIADSVWGFASIVGGEKGKERLTWGADKLKEFLPAYSQIQVLFPDEGIDNGIEAVMVGKKGWYTHIGKLYGFCEIGNEVGKILLLCDQNSWQEEKNKWTEIKGYFQNLLLNISLSSVNPRLVETVYEKVLTEKESVGAERLAEINKRVSAWKYARGKVWQKASRRELTN